MNPVEIEEAVSELAAAPFDRAEFPFEFLAAFGNPKTTIARLRRGSTNQSDIEGGVLQRSNIHIAICDPGAVAATLGARPTTVLRTVTMPLVLPGLVSGAVLAFARSLGEFGATLTFAGSLQGVTRTLPLEIYLQRETDADAAVALSLLLIVVATAIVIATASRRLAGPL